jgi:hypothetical protein
MEVTKRQLSTPFCKEKRNKIYHFFYKYLKKDKLTGFNIACYNMIFLFNTKIIIKKIWNEEKLNL